MNLPQRCISTTCGHLYSLYTSVKIFFFSFLRVSQTLLLLLGYCRQKGESHGAGWGRHGALTSVNIFSDCYLSSGRRCKCSYGSFFFFLFSHCDAKRIFFLSIYNNNNKETIYLFFSQKVDFRFPE